ncbi:MAG: geranylgeranyl diphosphate reductase [Beijerinckiaceae bacterium]|nr:geranylgeranyl diphosphate reductase [Beijerinckiaceae bacterium]
MAYLETFDVVVVGGGPSGATAANDLARQGRSVLMLDRAGRIKPCGGAIPPRLMRDFDIPDSLLCTKVRAAEIIAPSARSVDMPIMDGGFVGMVDRDVFDEWLRERAVLSGAERRSGTFTAFSRDEDGTAIIEYKPKAGTETKRVRARAVIGADGAVSGVAKQAVPQAGKIPYVFAYHEIIRMPEDATPQSKATCGVYYQGKFSPDFYAWIFPHGKTISVGTGTAHKGFSLRTAVEDLRAELGLDTVETVRREGAPLPLYPAKRWDNGRDVVLAGDAAGVVAPASGEGIYYAMLGGRLAGEAVQEFLLTGSAKALGLARKRFMKEHGKVFFVLSIMQKFWYKNDKRRERFVSMCKDKDVQRLTWESYMNKKLVRKDPLAHLKIFLKDTAHLLGLVSPTR